MGKTKSVYGGRVARRIVGLFIVSALLPVVVMAGVSFVAVTRQLEGQSRERLGQLTRNAGQSILQQLRAVQVDLQAVRARIAEGSGTPGGVVAAVVGMGITTRDGGFTEVVAMPEAPAPVSPSERVRLASDRMIVRLPPEGTEAFVTGVLLDPDDASFGILWAAVVADSIWGPAETFVTLPSVTDFCVLAAARRPLHCRSGSTRFADGFATLGSEGLSGVFSHEDGTDRFLVGHWSFYPDSDFDSPPWTVLVVEDLDALNAPADTFRQLFALTLLLAVLLVVLLSNVQIRRTMEPLTALRLGTDRVAAGDLESRVDVRSDDEFGALAASFNAMAAQLGTQFAQFEAVQAVSQATLSSFERDTVVTVALNQLPVVSGCRSAAVLVVSKRGGVQGEMLWLIDSSTLGGTDVTLEADDQRWMRAHPECGTEGSVPPAFFDAARRGLGNGTLVAFPHLVQGDIQGATLIELDAGADGLDEGMARRVRQLTDQLAVGLEDVRLVGEFEDLSWGALIALARTIDAKSEWTWGHSERVTEMALALARQMGLDEDDLDTLHRGGLLHDIGKIGISGSVLDKAGSLTDEEMTMVQTHPEIGVRILEPVGAFAAVLPLVLHHHEKWDGSGYPAGLAGEDIPFLARILAVADAYDAMASARPYRAATEAEVVLERVVTDSGTHFDPKVVEALVRHMAGKARVESREAGRSVPESIPMRRSFSQ